MFYQPTAQKFGRGYGSAYSFSGTVASKHSTKGTVRLAASNGAVRPHRSRPKTRSIPQEAARGDVVCAILEENGLHRLLTVPTGELSAERHTRSAAWIDEKAEGSARGYFLGLKDGFNP